MPPEVVAGNLSYRVLNQNTGAVVIPDLPHLHQSASTVRALQQGFSAGASLGDVRILLPAPYSEDWKRNASLFQQLAVGQKVEAFAGPITGKPKFSWVITRLEQPLRGNWAIIGSDTLYWLQQSQILPGEVVTPSNSLTAFGKFMGTREVLWDDDFSGGATDLTNNYANTGWTAATDPLFGLPAITATAIAPTVATAVANPSSVVLAEYRPSYITIQGVLSAGTDTSISGEASILLLADNATPTQTGLMGRIKISQSGAASNLWNVSTEIFSISGGVYTGQGSSGVNVISGIRNTLPFEVSVTFYRYTPAGGTLTDQVSVSVNGQKPTATWAVGSFTLPASGRVGVRFSVNTGGSPAVYINRLKFHGRPEQQPPGTTPTWGTPRFAVGNMNAGSVTLNEQDIVSSSQSHLDFMLMLASRDGVQIRKNAGFGFKADSLDYATTPGTDLSTSIAFDENTNVVDAAILPLSEVYSTDARILAIPGGTGSDTGGAITWSRLAAAGDMALVDSVADVGLPNFELLLRFARTVQSRKNNPMVVVQIEVTRSADTADKWRELDYVTVNIPTLGINRQKSQIVAYNYIEGQATQTVWLAALPDSYLMNQLQRLRGSIDYMASTYQQR